jgi:DNA-binding LytR/AlgR family response regulator
MTPALRVLVVDDEQLAREELCYQLRQRADVEVVAQASNGLEALAAVESSEPDLVFLDVQMPGLSGFEVARRLIDREPSGLALVFVTAFDQHAIEAFEVNAVDYLLKPIDAARLEQALARTRQRLARDAGGGDRSTNSSNASSNRWRVVRYDETKWRSEPVTDSFWSTRQT